MNGHDFIDSILKEVLDVIKPTRDHWVSRLSVINEIREVVLSVENLRDATVEPFGSFVANLFSRWGDLDISIDLFNADHVSSCGKNRKVNLLTEVLAALRQKGICQKLKFYASARVPILKFESKHHRISCDLSVDNYQGQMKSKFLFWISEIDGRFRDMVLLVKEWAKAHNINNPKNGTLNSYSLCLLVIFHFQTCMPPILPPLRDLYPINMIEDLTGLRANAERKIAQTCAANIARFKSNKYREANRSSLCELFISFLGKFSDIGTMAQHLGISTFTGRWEEIRNNTRWQPKTYVIFIEDPFEQPENAGRAVSLRQMGNITEAFRKTRYSLVSIHQTKSSVLTTIAGPHVFHSIVRPQPMIYQNHHPSQIRRPQRNGQVKPESKNAKQANHSQSLTTSRQMPKNSQEPRRPVQKKKNMWRRKPEAEA
ncbi:hypothetical protein ACFE04_029987 [Oxalis oulophora]